MQAWDDLRIAGGLTTQLARRRARVAAGERPIGWKLGLGAPAMLEKFTLKAPLVGHLFQGGVLASGATDVTLSWGDPIALNVETDRKQVTRDAEAAVRRMTAAALRAPTTVAEHRPQGKLAPKAV